MDASRHRNGYGLTSSPVPAGEQRSLEQLTADLFRNGLSSDHEPDVAGNGGSKSGRVIVVSNRVGLPSADGKARAGGLEVVMRSFIKRNRGIWFGWSGQIAQRGEENVRTVERGGVTYITTDLNRNDYQEYYNGFANRMLWPILHYRLDLIEFSNRDLSGYLRVTRSSPTF